MIPTEPIEFWKYFDGISLGILFIVIGSLLLKHHIRRGILRGSISEIVAADVSSSRIFTAVMCVCFPLYYAFLWFWVAPGIGFPDWVYGIIFISALTECVFVLVPATSGWRKRVHGSAAAVTAASMLLLPALILVHAVALPPLIIGAIIGFYILSSALAILILRNNQRAVFIYEVAYISYFLGLISLVGHVYIS